MRSHLILKYLVLYHRDVRITFCIVTYFISQHSESFGVYCLESAAILSAYGNVNPWFGIYTKWLIGAADIDAGLHHSHPFSALKDTSYVSIAKFQPRSLKTTYSHKGSVISTAL